MPMFETLKQKFTGEETMRREDPPREDKRAAAAEEMNSDDLVTGGRSLGRVTKTSEPCGAHGTAPIPFPRERMLP